MSFSFSLKFWLVVGLQILILISIWGFNYFHFAGGERVLLRLAPPRDPLSLFQGHYLILDYEISQIKVSDLPNGYDSGQTDCDFLSDDCEPQLKIGNSIFVVLQESNGYWIASKISGQKPKDGVFIRGKISGGNISGFLAIQYGIEQYFIPEKNWEETERKFNNLRSDEKIFVEVSLSSSGEPLIRKIIVKNITESNSAKSLIINQPATSQRVPSSNIKAQDSRIQSAMAQARTVMVYIFADDNNYDRFDCNEIDMQVLCSEVAQDGGSLIVQKDQGVNSQTACIFSRLNESGKWYCADSSGKAGKLSINPSAVGYCVSGTATCPPPIEQ